MGTSLIAVPLTLKHLGNERFRLWMIISLELAMVAFADFGVCNGVLNILQRHSGKMIWSVYAAPFPAVKDQTCRELKVTGDLCTEKAEIPQKHGSHRF